MNALAEHKGEKSFPKRSLCPSLSAAGPGLSFCIDEDSEAQRGEHVASEDKGDLSTNMSDPKAQALTCISRSGFAFDKVHFGFFLALGAFKKEMIKTKLEQ